MQLPLDVFAASQKQFAAYTSRQVSERIRRADQHIRRQLEYITLYDVNFHSPQVI